MLLMWLGGFVLMAYGLRESQKHWGSLFQILQKRILLKHASPNIVPLMQKTLLLCLTEASPWRAQMSAFALYNLRIVDKRSSLLWMALANVGAWWVLCLGLLFMKLSGVALLGICILIFLPFSHRIEKIGALLMATGLFLLGAELTLRNSALLQSLLGPSDLAFFLADGRVPALVSIFLISVVLSFLFQLEYWSAVMALALLSASVLSFNGALVLFAGEQVARGLCLAWQGRRLNQECVQVSRWMGGVQVIAALLGLVVAFSAKSYMDLGAFTLDAGALGRAPDFVLTMALMLFVQTVAAMIAGHFLALVPAQEIQEAHYFAKSWRDKGWLSLGALAWAKEKIGERLQEVRYHLQGLATYQQGQIPDLVQNRLKTEEKELARLNAELGHEH